MPRKKEEAEYRPKRASQAVRLAREGAKAPGTQTRNSADEKNKDTKTRKRNSADRMPVERTGKSRGKDSQEVYTGRRVKKQENLKDRNQKNRELVSASDIRRMMNKKTDMTAVIIALLTAVFECLGMLLASVHTQQTVGTDSLSMIAVIVPLGLVTTLVLPRFFPMDSVIMAITNFLCGVGIVTLCTVSPARGNRQILYYALGLGVMLVTSLIVKKAHRFRGITILMMIAGIAALAMPLLFGKWNNGAKNWVEVPLFGSFQPSELVKIAVIFSLAYSFSARRTLLQMMPALLFSAICLFMLMLQRDLGTALIYYISTLAVFYIACGNIPLTLVGVGGGIGAAMLGYRMFAHVKVRVAMWRNPWSDPTGSGYQIIQALLAISSGGLFGVGLGQGTPEKIPEYYNDFIFAVICEQFGQIFGVLLVILYVLLMMRGLAISHRSRRSLIMLMGYGTVAMMGAQTFMIIGGVIKLIPLTGVTTPFLSYGGSSMVSCLAMIGILHGIAGRAQQELEEELSMDF